MAKPLFVRFWPYLILLATACIPLARVLLDPLGSLPGSEASDVYKHAWPYWHTLAQIADGSWPYTRYLNAPDGGLLLDVMVLPSLIMAPVTLVVGPVLATNLWVLLSLWAVGAATFALCRHLTGSVAGGLAAGVLCQTCPFLMGYALTSGVHERLALWFFPLLVLGLLRLREGGGWRWPALLVAGLALTISQCPTYGLFCAALLAFMVPFVVRRPGSYGPGQLPRLVTTYAGMAAVMIGTYEVYRWFVLEPTFLAGIPPLRITLTVGLAANLPEHEAATLASLLNPWAVRASQPVRIDDELYRLVYLGWVPLAAALAGAILAWRRGQRTVLAVAALGAVFLALSLGAEVALGPWKVPNPLYLAVAAVLPFYGGIPPVWQQAGLFAILSAPAVAALVAALPRRPLRLAAVAVISLAALAERALVLPVPLVLDAAPARISEAYDKVSDEGDDGLVDVPRFFHRSRVARGFTFLAQTRHRRPIPVAINMGISRYDAYRPVTRGLADDWSHAAACLRRGKIRWLMVHPRWYEDKAAAEHTVRELSKVLGAPVFRGRDEVLFDLSRLARDPGTSGRRCPRTSGRRKRWLSTGAGSLDK